MATGNFDVLVQLHEKALNKSLAMVFYSGMLKVNGKYELDTSLPDTMKPYTTFDYEISLANEPFVDFRSEDTIFLRFNAQLKVTILSGIHLKFNLDFYVQSVVKFDFPNQKLNFELQDAKIVKIGIQSEYYVGKAFLDKLNFIIEEVLKKYFKNQVKTIDLPIALTGLPLPMMPPGDANKLPVSKIELKILNNKVLAAGLSFFQNQGSLTSLTDLTNNRDCYIAVRNQAVFDILNFWWTHTSFSKKQEFDQSIEIGFANPLARGLDSATRILTIGFIQTERDYENMVLHYGGTIYLDKKPDLIFKTGNQVEIANLEIKADVFANIYADVLKNVYFDTSSFVSDNFTPWKDDITLKHIDENKKLLELKNTFTLQIKSAEGKLQINNKNNLAVKITNADFELKFNKKGSTFSENTWEKLMKFLKDKVLEKIPEIIVSPSLILADKNIFGFTLDLSDTDLIINTDEINFSTNVVIRELKSNTVAVPNYIGNKLTKIIHLFNCKYVSDINADSRVGYYVMYEALADHYLACKNCLQAYNLK